LEDYYKELDSYKEQQAELVAKLTELEDKASELSEQVNKVAELEDKVSSLKNEESEAKSKLAASKKKAARAAQLEIRSKAAANKAEEAIVAHNKKQKLTPEDSKEAVATAEQALEEHRNNKPTDILSEWKNSPDNLKGKRKAAGYHKFTSKYGEFSASRQSSGEWEVSIEGHPGGAAVGGANSLGSYSTLAEVRAELEELHKNPNKYPAMKAAQGAVKEQHKASKDAWAKKDKALASNVTVAERALKASKKQADIGTSLESAKEEAHAAAQTAATTSKEASAEAASQQETYDSKQQEYKKAKEEHKTAESNHTKDVSSHAKEVAKLDKKSAELRSKGPPTEPTALEQTTSKASDNAHRSDSNDRSQKLQDYLEKNPQLSDEETANIKEAIKHYQSFARNSSTSSEDVNAKKQLDQGLKQHFTSHDNQVKETAKVEAKKTKAAEKEAEAKKKTEAKNKAVQGILEDRAKAEAIRDEVRSSREKKAKNRLMFNKLYTSYSTGVSQGAAIGAAAADPYGGAGRLTNVVDYGVQGALKTGSSLLSSNGKTAKAEQNELAAKAKSKESPNSAAGAGQAEEPAEQAPEEPTNKSLTRLYVIL
jgi:hypothetical protein